MAGDAGYRAVPQQLPHLLGIIPQACGGGRALSVAAPRRRQRRPARLGLPSKQPGAALGRPAAIDIVIMNFDPQALRAFEHAGWQRAAPDYLATFAPATSGFAETARDPLACPAAIRILHVTSRPQ